MSDDIKRRMNIALVGIRPADQVLLKGYFRVLLRLDVELNWVAATDKQIDLFMIHGEFSSAGSVTKLLESRKSIPVLYVNRDEAGVGGVTKNTLTIPLKQLNLLNDWLMENIPALTQTGPVAVRTETEGAPTKRPESLQSAVEMIKTLQARPNNSFELLEGDRLVALIDARRQLIWPKGAVTKISPEFRLRTYQGQLPDEATAKDSTHYLWLLTWHNPDALIPLINHDNRYKLKYWAKPPMALRRDLLHIMTALEKDALTVNQVAQQANVSVLTAKKALTALLVSGHLTDDSYRSLTYLVERETKVDIVMTSQVEPPIVQTQPQEQDEKSSFLSRLRRKLGI